MAGASGETTGGSYGNHIGYVYIFNLIVGAGALTIPQAFATAGTLGGLVIIFVICFFSYISATFVIESLSVANALQRSKFRANFSEIAPLLAEDRTVESPAQDPANTQTQMKDVLSIENLGPDIVNVTSFEKVFEFSDRIELGKMAKMFFPSWGVKAFNVCIIAYLLGDLAIYAVAVPKAVTNVICGESDSGHDVCTSSSHMTLLWGDVYHLSLSVFAILLAPFCFFDVQKTKLLQVITTVMRYAAFGTMIGISGWDVLAGRGRGELCATCVHAHELPTLFGVLIYAFMCHHSLPGIVSPLEDKGGVYRLLAADFATVLTFYLTLTLFALLDFPEGDLEDLYTANFSDYGIRAVGLFLALYPAFTLSTNFPIIAITLINNVRALLHRSDGGGTGAGTNGVSGVFNRVILPFAAIIPPILLAYVTRNVTLLVSITGSYAGVAIQFVTPACLVLCARSRQRHAFGPAVINPFQSPFRHPHFAHSMLALAALSVCVITYNHITSWTM
eukprot:TRINITY_DN4754_c0_g1::TRINITY_DN4754_c0_g1_i1::g.21288::m.21288 TRINITY_DN4754_c0_g1::TRINITY_DN4754_c0_g1_i1::g.21288  ORF type:complete len:504 (-),score=68.34,sp/Q8NE00/TM104_HUMAN/40.97/2e-108,Aa_trans/PF01490.13/5.1e-15,Trp_Tyr_perm/PF03222.8/8.8e-05,Trp_Tyr_perm/PF03222.8/3.1e+02,ESAG1/PF03238.8/0.35,Reticulon/PF02453.12/1.2e+03,Reticulon/PF02453.12/0.77 TRINITY_DN4754_c0_g1_i1:585-2096(-)